MQRFILQQNLIRFRKLLTEEAGNNPHRTLLQSLIVSTQRELALFNSTSSGIGLGVWSSGSPRAGINRDGYSVGQFQREFESSPHLYMVLDPRPSLHIIDVNDAYARTTMTTRAVVAGERLFHAFPDYPCADGVQQSVRLAEDRGRNRPTARHASATLRRAPPQRQIRRALLAGCKYSGVRRRWAINLFTAPR